MLATSFYAKRLYQHESKPTDNVDQNVMKKVLIVEDDKRMRHLVALYLKKEGWSVIEACNGDEGVELFHAHNIDLLVLDIMLPGKDGWTVCRAARKADPTVPIVMLTARKSEDDEIFGFELGANDYITKPFNPNILVARIKAAFNKGQQQTKQIDHPDLSIDCAMHIVDFMGAEINLSPKEYELLFYLAKDPRIARSRTQILDSVWGINSFVNDRVVDSTVKRLRHKLAGRYISTVRGLGYRFDPDSQSKIES